MLPEYGEDVRVACLSNKLCRMKGVGRYGLPSNAVHFPRLAALLGHHWLLGLVVEHFHDQGIVYSDNELVD